MFDNDTNVVSPPVPDLPPRPPRRHRVRTTILASVAGLALLIIGLSIGSAGSNPAAAKPAPTITVIQHDAAPAPTATQTTHVTVTQTATVAPPAITVARYSGTGTWNSPQFTLSGQPLTVTFSYSGNSLPGEGSGDNFMADITSGSDDLQIANEIGVSGGKTTTLYPDLSGGGSSAYHLEIQATGYWSVTITQAGS